MVICLILLARLLVNDPPLEPGILSKDFCEDTLMNGVRDRQSEWYHDLNNYYLSLNELFSKWRDR